MKPLAFIPRPPSSGVHIGPLFIHAYGLAYVAAVIAAVAITVRRWERRGGQRALVYEVAAWGFPAGLIGGRIYFGYQLGPGTKALVGPARDLAGRAWHLGRDCRGHDRRPLGASPGRR